jgi:hypothetical protein
MADKRKETEDVLGNVLDEDPDSTPEQTATAEQSREEQGREEATDSSGQEGGAEELNSSEEVPKRKATYYLREDTLSKLEELWFQLRQQADEGEKRSVSKSAIVDAALQDAIDEFNTDGGGDPITRQLLE